MTLLTGYRGFIGSKLFLALFNSGENPIGLDVRDGYNLLTCDLPPGVDTIYHLAAQSSVESSWHDPLHDLDNIRMTARLVHAYPEAKIIYANSCASIGKASPYGFSKAASGEYLRLFHDNFVSCIFPNIYGPGSKSVVDVFKGKDEVTIYGDGLQKRDYVHVDDIVEGLVKAKDWPVGEYSIGSGKSLSVLDLADDKFVQFAPARKEAREVVVPNDTPDWVPTIDVFRYMKQ